MALGAAVERTLARLWWQPRVGLAAQLLRPLSWLYGRLAARQRLRAIENAQAAPVPIVVVGNIVVGGAGKTPLVIALVEALRAAGRHPGVISRGHGRRSHALVLVQPDSLAAEVGDEPLLIARRTGAPVVVAARRIDAARALCAARPEVDVLVCDDGLQHHALTRQAQIMVFDDRGIGNGLLLPAGPLRESLPQALPPRTLVVYTGRGASTPLPGTQVPRGARVALPLKAWRDGAHTEATLPLERLQGRRLTALAGIAAPAQFFSLLREHGLAFDELAAPDHVSYPAAPWPRGTPAVITTEKDAVKLAALPAVVEGETAVWVVPLDCEVPAPLLERLLEWTSSQP